MAQKPPDGLPWGPLPSGAQTVLREMGGGERDPAHRGRSFISRDKEKETTRPTWTINSLSDTYACTDIHTQHSIIRTLKDSQKGKKTPTHSCQFFSLSYTKNLKLRELICFLCGIKGFEHWREFIKR